MTLVFFIPIAMISKNYSPSINSYKIVLFSSSFLKSRKEFTKDIKYEMISIYLSDSF